MKGRARELFFSNLKEAAVLLVNDFCGLLSFIRAKSIFITPPRRNACFSCVLDMPGIGLASLGRYFFYEFMGFQGLRSSLRLFLILFDFLLGKNENTSFFL
jgi:hypothetical protein